MSIFFELRKPYKYCFGSLTGKLLKKFFWECLAFCYPVFLSLINYPSSVKYILNYPRVVASYIESPNTELRIPEIKLF